MDLFKQIWDQLSTVLKWWVIILPWEMGLRVRAGKKVTILEPGIHFRLPYIDTCYRQAIRINFFNMAPQTLTTNNGVTLTISLIVGYSICDVLKVHNTVSEIDSAIAGTVMGGVSDFISTSHFDNCQPAHVEQHILICLGEKDWGVKLDEVKVISYATVKTYRLIQDGAWMSNSHKLDQKV